MSQTPPSLSKRRPRAAAVTIILLLGVALAVWYGWKRPVEQLATRAIREALPRDVEVGEVDIESPRAISLKDVRRGDVSADEIEVSFSAVSALRDGAAAAVKRVEVIRPVIEIDEVEEAGNLTPLELAELIGQAVTEVASSGAAGFDAGLNTVANTAREAGTKTGAATARDAGTTTVAATGSETAANTGAKTATNGGTTGGVTARSNSGIDSDPASDPDGGFGGAPDAGRGAGPEIVISDGVIRVGGEEVVSGVSAQLTQTPEGISARVNRALVRLNGVPWVLRGEYRPVPSDQGAAVHSLRLTASHDRSRIDASGEIGNRLDLTVGLVKVDPADLGALALGGGGLATVMKGADLLGPADGSLRIAGAPGALMIDGALSGSASELLGEETEWRLELSGGGEEPLRSRLSIGDEALNAVYAASGQTTLRVSGEDVPVELVWRLLRRLYDVPSLSQPLAGTADVLLTVENRDGGPTALIETRLMGLSVNGVVADEANVTGSLDLTPGGAFAFSAEVAGDASGELSATGSWTEGGVSGSLTVPWTYYKSFSLTDGTFEFAGGGERPLTVNGEAVVGGGTVVFRNVTPHAGGLKGEIQLTDVSAPAVGELLRSAGIRFEGDRSLRGSVSGAASFELDAEGRWVVEGSVRGDRLGYRELVFDRFSAEGVWDEGDWRIEKFAATSGESVLTLSARGAGGQIEGNGTYQGGAETGNARVEFSAGGDLSERLTFKGKGTAGDGAVAFDASWNPGTQSYRIEGSVARFPLETLSGSNGANPLSGTTSGPFLFEAASDKWRADAQLTLTNFSYGGATFNKAGLDIDLSSQSENQPACDGCLFGEGRFWGDTVIKGQNGTKRVDVRFDLDGSKGLVTLEPIAVFGGQISGGGSLRLSEGAWRFDLRSTGRGLDYKRDGIEALVDFGIALGGTLTQPDVTGTVTVHRGQLDLFRLPRSSGSGGSSRSGSSSSSRSGSGSSSSSGSGEGSSSGSGGGSSSGSAGRAGGRSLRRAYFDPDLDLTIDIKAAQVTAGSMLEGEVEGTLGLKGSVLRPQVFGEVSLVRGDFRYLGSRFEATDGKVAFRGGSMPVLQVTGTRTVDGVEISVDVSGPANDLSLAMSSTPSLPQSDILELLRVPASVDLSDGWNRLALSLADWANAELTSQVYWRIGQAFEDALDVDQFRLDQSEGALQLTVGKYVNPDLYLSYSRSLDGTLNHDVAAEYRLSPNVLLTSEWGSEDRRDVGIRISVPF